MGIWGFTVQTPKVDTTTVLGTRWRVWVSPGRMKSIVHPLSFPLSATRMLPPALHSREDRHRRSARFLNRLPLHFIFPVAVLDLPSRTPSEPGSSHTGCHPCT